MEKRLVVIRIRGSVNVDKDIAHALDSMRLKRVNNAILVDNRPSYLGTLQKVKDYVTWGEVDSEDAALILKNRGEVEGVGSLTDNYVKEGTKFKSIKDFSRAFVDFKAELNQIPGLKPIFRLHPPRKGHKGIKRSFSVGGSLGNRGARIKDLVHKMR